MVQKSIYDLIFDLSAKIRGLEAERDALRKDAGRYRFIKDDRIVLAGGPWPVAPFGEECDRKIDAAIAAKEPNHEQIAKVTGAQS